MWKGLFGRRGRPCPAAAPPRTFAIACPKPYLPVASTADPLDAEIADLWLAFQQRQTQPTWDAFLAHLAEDNAKLAQMIAELRAQIADDAPFVETL